MKKEPVKQIKSWEITIFRIIQVKCRFCTSVAAIIVLIIVLLFFYLMFKK